MPTEHEILQSVFDNIPVMISFYDADGRLLRVNRHWERTLGWTIDEARGIDILEMSYPDPKDRQDVLDFVARADSEWTPFRPRTKDGRVLETSWLRLRLSDGSRIGFGLDVTGIERTKDALAESESRFMKIFQASPIALGMSTIEDGRIIDVNGSWLELFGYQREEVIGRTNAELRLAVDPSQRQATVARARREGTVRELEMQVRRRSGEVLDVVASAVTIDFGDGGSFFLSSVVDATASKRVQAERDALSRRLLTAQEEERRRVAFELHGDLGQLLTAAKIKLETAMRESTGAAVGHLHEAAGCVDQAMQRVRELSLDLRPSVLDDLGLAAALRWFLNRFSKKMPFETHFSIDEVAKLDAAVESACFRVSQEALTNVTKHAQARNVWFDLHLLGDALEIGIRDDGVGFDVAEARTRALHGASVGLLGMEERTSLVGGEFELISRPGGGTSVRARIPVRGSRS
jgi:PAS domain S-box-containing protein